jgi:hypothetical protein
MAEKRKLVTTFIPTRSLEDYGEGSSAVNQQHASAVTAFDAGQSRKRAFLRLIRKQEGRETLLVSVRLPHRSLYDY